MNGPADGNTMFNLANPTLSSSFHSFFGTNIDHPLTDISIPYDLLKCANHLSSTIISLSPSLIILALTPKCYAPHV